VRAALAVVAALAVGCGGGGDDDDQPDAAPVDISSLTYRPCRPDVYVGGFEVELDENGETSVSGDVKDSADPYKVYEVLSESGACRMLRAPMLFCDPACGVGEVCTAGATCAAAPTSRDVGTVSVAGLPAAVEMTRTSRRPPYSTSAGIPPFEVGSGMRLDATGGDYEAFSLLGAGVATLETSTEVVPVESGQAVSVTWDASADPGPAKVIVELNVNRHGLRAIWLECVVDDNGAFEIPEPTVTELVDDGLSGFPGVVLIRQTVDSTMIEPGCVDLRVVSRTAIEVEVPGLESCNLDTDCTPPETCLPELICG
jgi:hypothetical protein